MALSNSACDKLVQHLLFDFFDKSESISFTELDNFSSAQVIQSLISVTKLKMIGNQQDHFGLWVQQCLKKRTISGSELCKIISPHLSIKIKQKNLKKHRIICLILLSTKTELTPDIFNYLRHCLTASNDEWTILYVLLAFEQAHLTTKRLNKLIINKKIKMLIRKWSEATATIHEAKIHHQLQLVCSSLIRKFAQKSTIYGSPKRVSLNPRNCSKGIKLSQNCLAVRSDSDGWQSVKSMYPAQSDIFYYEAILITGGSIRLGWATSLADLTRRPLGEDRFSVGVDGFKSSFYHDNAEYPEKTKFFMKRWKAGDIIGCLIDVQQEKFDFIFDDQCSTIPSIYFSFRPYYAALSLTCHQQVLLNFGQHPFKYKPRLERLDKYWSFQAYWKQCGQLKQVKIVDSKCKNVLLQVNSDMQCDKIVFSTKKRSAPDQEVPKTIKCFRIKCQFCKTPSTSQLNRFECCDQFKFCSNCISIFKTCPRHQKAELKIIRLK